MDFFEHGGRIGKNIRYDFSANINPLGLPEGGIGGAPGKSVPGGEVSGSGKPVPSGGDCRRMGDGCRRRGVYKRSLRIDLCGGTSFEAGGRPASFPHFF